MDKGDDVDEDMLTMMDGLSMDDIGSQHYKWTVDIDPYDDLSYYFITAYEQYRKMTADNSTTNDDDEDALFLNNWDAQAKEHRVNLGSSINKNPMGLVAIDANQPSLLQPHLISIDQQPQPQPQPQPTKKKPLKRAPSLSAPHPSPSSSSKPQRAKATSKKPKPSRQLQPKNPNV